VVRPASDEETVVGGDESCGGVDGLVVGFGVVVEELLKGC
jgi:hypothetical protein